MTAFALTEDRRRFGGLFQYRTACMAVLVLLVLVGRFPAGPSGRVHAGDVLRGASIERFPSTTVPGTSVVVRVRDAALAHTTQLFPGSSDSTDAAMQVSSLLAKLDAVLRNGDAARGSVVKLNVYVRDSSVRAVFLEQLSLWSPDAPPAVAFVATPLPDENAVFAVDAVFAVKNVAQTGLPSFTPGAGQESNNGASRVSVLPPGDVVYVSGQAAAGELAEATAETLDGLLKTIEALNLDRSHIVQIKTFMKPMSQVEVVNREIAAFFGKSPVPPVSHVEWLSGSRPIEIELVAWAPPKASGETVSYFTPEWMKSSPVFSRVARIHGNDRVYVSGLEAAAAGDGESQVRSVFESLQGALTAAGSDLRHLAKATYYVSDADVSSQLNALRPSLYDPERPPAASKALIADVGTAERTISVDIIAAPAKVAQKSQDAAAGSDEGGASNDDAQASLRISAEVDFGTDLGQSFGSLFEVRNKAGRVVAGAGFADVYNTRFRTGRRTLQFFVRPETDAAKFEVERLPHPDLDCGVYLCEFDQEIYAWSSVRGNSVRKWNEKLQTWVNELPPGMPAVRSGDGLMRLGNGRLVFSNDSAWYDDRQILSPPEVGGYFNFYYAAGHLFFYHRNSDEDDQFTRVVACPWTPESDGAIELSSAVILKTKYERETPFTWAQYGEQILTVSNQGGIYVFEHGKWKTILESDNQVSYQVYSGLRWHDRLLLAQYPTGNIFEYRGQEAVRLKDWPPVMPGVSTSSRECQTLGIYRGNLLAGVWPWAELWRRDRDAEKWDFSARMFTHPELTDKTTHPYEADADRYGLVRNHWGQRVTSLIPQHDSLLLSTSSKGTYEWDDRYDFLTDAQRREYGAVLRLRLPGNLAVQPEWTSGPTKLHFDFDGKQLSITQDGRQLAATEVGDDFTVNLSDVSVNWAQGVFGPFNGTLVRGPAR
ncbi:MAG: enamine deaminase RidA (YjgF/YER057c/UK114 family) [Planctomycetaceae bacterium]|jgi:enamine deaminase RidA (YjgF/YER057c/UK114 family)